jgi:hypothetical protein
MDFDRRSLSVQMAAQHLNFGPDQVESAHKVRIFISNLEQLKKRHSDENFYVVPRVSRGLSATIKRLGRRDDDWSDSDQESDEWGPPNPTKKRKHHNPRGDNRSNFDEKADKADKADTKPDIMKRDCPTSDESSSCNEAGTSDDEKDKDKDKDKEEDPKKGYDAAQKDMDETFHPSANIHFSKNL